MEETFEYGHPFWLLKPKKEDFLGDDGFLLLMDMFQSGHCFQNPYSGRTCHADSYMTILVYGNVKKTFETLQKEFNFDKEFWIRFADFHINHINKQLITCLLGHQIKRLIETFGFKN